jgi:membrane-bound serine protease (ClpP class)
MKSAAILLAVAALAALPGFTAEAPPRLVHVVTVRDAIHPVSAGYIARALREAGARDVALIVLKLETPGGLVSSTEEIIEAIKGSKPPVAVFVHSSKAASAGFLIALASDFAAMAPGTRIGAAHPVGLLGDGGQKDKKEGDAERPVMQAKIENDLAALARTLAQNRGRNVAAAEAAVRRSVSYTEREALEQRLIEAICGDLDELLRVLDGRELRRFDGRRHRLALSGAQRLEVPMNLKERVLSVIANPTLALALLALGVLGVYVEFTHPGAVLPGVVGAVCLLLFAFATQILPVNVMGLLLILASLVMFILEVSVTSYGMLALTGVALLVLGSLMLFNTPIPEMRVPLAAVLPIAAAVGGVAVLVLRFALRAQRARVATGREGLVGELGRALEDLAPRGKVFVHGETWDARSRRPARQGQRVRVLALEGMELEVEPQDE